MPALPSLTALTERFRLPTARDSGVKLVAVLVLIFSLALAAAFWNAQRAGPVQLHEAGLNAHLQSLSRRMQGDLQRIELMLNISGIADAQVDGNEGSDGRAFARIAKSLGPGLRGFPASVLARVGRDSYGAARIASLRLGDAVDDRQPLTPGMLQLITTAAERAGQSGTLSYAANAAPGSGMERFIAFALSSQGRLATVMVVDAEQWLAARFADHDKWLNATLISADHKAWETDTRTDTGNTAGTAGRANHYDFSAITPSLSLEMRPLPAHVASPSIIFGAGGIAMLGIAMSALVLLLGARGNQAEVSATLAGHALTESEKRLQRALQLTQDGIWEYDLYSRDFHLSGQARLLLAWQREAPPSPRAILRLLPRQWRREFIQTVRAAARGASTQEMKLPLQDALSARWLKVRICGTHDARGRPWLLTGSIADISEEIAQSQVQERYRAMLMRVLDALPVPVAVHSADHKTLMVNERYAAQLMNTLGTQLERNGRLAALLEELNVQAIATGEPQVTHEWLRTDDGTEFFLRITRVLCDGIDGEPNVVGTYEDLTEVQHQAQQQSRLRSFLQAVFDAVPHPLFVKDMQHRYVMTNRAHAESVGVDMQSIIGKRSRDFVSEDAAEAIEISEEQLFARGSTEAMEGEYVLPHSNGQTRNTIIRKALCIDADGSTVLVGVNTDITRLRDAEAGLRRHRDQLTELVREQTIDLVRAKEVAERANETKSSFLANMSHELRTPLHAILSFARLGESRGEGLPPEKIHDYFNRIRVSGERLLLMLNDLLDLARLEAGRMRLDWRLVTLENCVLEVSHEFEAWLTARRLHLATEIAPDLPRVMADASRIGQVMRNLLSNAIKFSPEGGKVSLRLQRIRLHEQDAVELCVADQGAGIPQRELETVFEKFIQSSNNKPEAGGTGLGLAICREIVAAHGGEIFARNATTGGAEFIVRLLVDRRQHDDTVPVADEEKA